MSMSFIVCNILPLNLRKGQNFCKKDIILIFRGRKPSIDTRHDMSTFLIHSTFDPTGSSNTSQDCLRTFQGSLLTPKGAGVLNFIEIGTPYISPC